MKYLWLFLALFAVGSLAQASSLTGGVCNGWGLTILTGSSVCGSAPSPPTCSNSLDFTDACNSQYIPTL